MSQPNLHDNKTLQILRAAEKGGYGVLAAVAYNMEHILGFVQAAEGKRSPLIIQFFPWAIKFSNGLLVHAAAQAAKTASAPIAVHLDHCQDADLVKEAAELPFDSIMIDMSHRPKAENLSRTAELVRYCRQRGIATEAEPGRIEGGEDGLSNTLDLTPLLTTAEETAAFVSAGIDILAPAFGNVHGEYGPRGVVLDWNRLARIHDVTFAGGVMLALHGVNRFPVNLTRRLVASGISKINVNRDILDDYYRHLQANVGKFPFTQLLEEGVEVVSRSMAHHMDIVLSSGKA